MDSRPPPTGVLARNIKKEEESRQLVLDFYEAVFVRHDLDDGVRVMSEDYKQHNPLVTPGKQGFVEFFRKMFSEYPEASNEVLRVAADGDLVWLHARAKIAPEDEGVMLVDIFRVEDGSIAEHWDVMQGMPGNTVL